MSLFFLKDYLEEFFQDKKLSLNSRKCYERDLDKFLEISSLPKSEISGEIKELEPKKLLKICLTLSERSKQRLCVNLRLYLLWLKEAKNLEINSSWQQSWKFNDYQKIQLSERSFQIPSKKEVEFLLSKQRQITSLKRVLLALVVFTGASLEELSNLTWEDFSKSGYLILGENSPKKRVLPLSQECLEILLNYQELSFFEERKSEYLLQTEKQQKIPATYFSLWLLKLSRKFLAKDYSARNYQAYAREEFLKKKGLKLSQKYLAKQYKNTLVRSNQVPELSVKELAELKELHRKAFL